MSASATLAPSIGSSGGGVAGGGVVGATGVATAAILPTMMSGLSVAEGATGGNATGSSMNVNPAICRYYQRGICRFGNLCRFSHDTVGGEVIESSGIETGDISNESPSTSTKSAAAQYHLNNRPSTSRSNWANAPVFVPKSYRPLMHGGELSGGGGDDDAITSEDGAAALSPTTTTTTIRYDVQQKSWADVVGGAGAAQRMRMADGASAEAMREMICPYEGPCPYGAYCGYGIHLELCKMCDQFCLHPSDQTQRRKHNQDCLQQHEQAMEWSFAIARSKDKTCGICFDTIMEKAGREKRFGILPNCNHIFCLECIRKWRQAKQFEHKITRSCPECRVCSDFVCPSAFWVETKEEKDKLLTDYRVALGIKDCKYFKKGDGKCPFGNKCFYKHALPNGELVDVGLPKRARKMHRGSNDFIDLLDIYLWEFVEQRHYHWLDFLSSSSDDSDDTDFSDE